MERVAKVGAWVGVAASAITVLAFLGIGNYDELRRALDGDSAGGSPPTGLEVSDPGASGGGLDDDATGGSWTGGDSGDDWTPEPEPEPEPAPDPTLDAYRAVNAGDCLHNWMTGESTWSAEVPEVISCDAEGAALWVSRISDAPGDCPADAGRRSLVYTGGDDETVALCVTRVFDVGQCILGMADSSANLMSWVDCQSSEVPVPYSRIYNVTGVYTAPAQHTGAECARTPGDPTAYTSWFADDNSVLVCAVLHAG
ncbi:LppU/SCO3897 family protein [Streptomyces avicenniae]|uniref:LppU/SCO3897 family protein n=1 Tax=Streptomyces avicenniae TaxID=500153 RepID=UPI0006998CB0|nr:hypothetical protein [Streptomyces avicenniae]